MNLIEIARYMQSQNLGQLGTNLFAYSMPAEIGSGLLVTAQVPISRHPYAQNLFRGEFQVIGRGDDHEELNTRLESVSDTLSGQGQQIGGMNFRFIRPLNAPLVFPRAESRLLEASVNFEFAFTQSV